MSESERERERETDTDRQTQRETETERDRHGCILKNMLCSACQGKFNKKKLNL